MPYSVDMPGRPALFFLRETEEEWIQGRGEVAGTEREGKLVRV